MIVHSQIIHWTSKRVLQVWLCSATIYPSPVCITINFFAFEINRGLGGLSKPEERGSICERPDPQCHNHPPIIPPSSMRRWERRPLQVGCRCPAGKLSSIRFSFFFFYLYYVRSYMYLHRHSDDMLGYIDRPGYSVLLRVRKPDEVGRGRWDH